MILKKPSAWEIAVLGAGTMGLSIAQFFAMHHHTVQLYNRTPANLEKALRQIEDNLKTLLSMEMIEQGEIARVLSYIPGGGDLKAAVQTADLIIENVAENVELKKTIFSKLDEYCKEDAILASDTSSMNIFEIVETSHPERLLITHFFNPAYVMPLVELVRGPETSDEVIEAAKTLMRASGKEPVVVNKVVPGFIVNRLTFALFREAAYMVEQGWCSAEDVDAAVVSTYGPRYTFEGPFGLVDFAGVDTYEKISEYLLPELCNDQAVPHMLREMNEGGKLGVKSGEGFYSYQDSVQARADRDRRIIKMIHAIGKVNKQFLIQ